MSDSSIDEAYSLFILYCNPSFPTSTDTSELKKVFRAPPKSEGKSFSTYNLFELISKLEAKEIKTWTELALELGVEKPNAEKGQSTQKVQQYTVRLKRWMRALHIDAFFEYLLDKPHAYCRKIPPLDDPFPEIRDGVPIEEDLAIRALDPKFRPKRGRRKADDQDDEGEPMSAVEPKRPHLDTSVAFGGPHAFANPHSAIPTSAMGMSAHPDDLDRFMTDPWMAATSPATARSAGVSQQLRWRVTSENPQTPHPMSTMTPISAQPSDGVFEEPQSAVSPNPKPRSRRRHGPAVSSAWSSNNTTPNGRLRGRPPSNRSIRDGPFVTFPANPKAKEGPTIDLSRNQITVSTADTISETQVITENVHQQSTPISSTSQHPPPGPLQSRPGRMQLQIPQHTGNPVHLVTPTVLVNGSISPPQPPSTVLPTASSSTLDTATSFRSSNATLYSQSTAVTDPGEHDGISFLPSRFGNPQPRASGGSNTNRPSATQPFSDEDLKRALAADLLRAEISGLARGRKRLRGAEAKDLAAAIMARLSDGRDFTSSNPDLVVSWLGLSLGGKGSLLGSSPSRSIGLGHQSSAKKIFVQRFRVNGDGYASPVDDEEEQEGAELTRGEDDGVVEIRETFDVEWTAQFGGLTGNFQMRELALGRSSGNSAQPHHDQARISDERTGQRDGNKATTGDAEDEGGWKQRVLELEKMLWEREEEVHRLRDKILEVVL